MRIKWLSLLLVLFSFAPFMAEAQSVALSGVVSSGEEGNMEGVLVNAKRAGSNMTITVVTDDKGRYQFPAAKLEPGKYTLSIRAVGYDLARRATVEVAAGGGAQTDLKLIRSRDIASQLTNAEWLHSMPGTDQEKRPLLGCVTCHTLERIVRSKYDADGFLQTIARMGTYANQSTPLLPQRRLTGRDTDVVGEDRVRILRTNAAFFESVNLHAHTTWEYDLKTFPRPKGRATRVIITEWDLPRPTIEPHDVVVDSKGMAWFSNFGEQTIGKFDPKTGKLVEIPVPTLKKGSPLGALSIRMDRDENMWLGAMYQAAILKYNTKTDKLEHWEAPPEFNRPNTQINMTSPMNIGVDGKVWAQNNGFAGVHRIDLKTGKWEVWEPYKESPQGHNIYDVISDSQNNGWFTNIGRNHIGRIDAKTGEVKIYETPTVNSGPRRASMDAQDRLWIGQYRGNRIAMMDTRTLEFKEWRVPTPWAAPYDVALDKNGEAWTGSMLNDRVARLNTQTGEFVEYLLPRNNVNIRRVFVENQSGPRTTFWVGSNHGASIIKLEPLD
ncbi:MAG: carboxypeptidase regulatory-like domain-containing protein [Burkholderiales bacterium]